MIACNTEVRNIPIAKIEFFYTDYYSYMYLMHGATTVTISAI